MSRQPTKKKNKKPTAKPTPTAAQAKPKVGAVMVVGGGIAGIEASLNLANGGYKVYLLEQSPSIGGTMARLDKTFPTNDCSMCILSPKLVEAGRHLNIELITYADLEHVEGEAGRFTVTLRRNARYVDPNKCTGCGLCGTVDVPNLDQLTEHNGELWIDRIDIDQIKCVQCGDCVRACVKENPDAPAMSSVHHRQSDPELPEPAESPSAVALRRVRTMNAEERTEYWRRQMAKCIKCYGCRDVCPVFIDREFRLEDWAEPARLPPNAPLYHLARAFYIAERCTNCGFCEETCPGMLPLRALVDLVRHEDPEQLFEFVPGLSKRELAKLRKAMHKRDRKLEERAT